LQTVSVTRAAAATSLRDAAQPRSVEGWETPEPGSARTAPGELPLPRDRQEARAPARALPWHWCSGRWGRGLPSQTLSS